VATKRVRIADLAGERFVVFQRTSSPEVFDTIVRACNDNGFSPRLHHELNNMNSVLATVEAGEGVAIIPATASNLRPENISFFRLQPDEVRIDFVAAWQKKEPSVALNSFLELLDEEMPSIREKMKFS
jgi:DNA-binding transcriptional LysR family regulator